MSSGQQGYTAVEMLLVVSIIAIVGAIAVPMTGSALDGQRFRGDAQALTHMVGLAKMRASAAFTRARVRANLDTRSFIIERWDRTTGAWVTEGGQYQASRGVSFGVAGLGLPPPNTQGTIGLSPACRTGLTTGVTSPAIPNTACVVFNSRGVPVDADGAVFGAHALYLTNGATVYGTTVTATPRIRLWWSPSRSPQWREQQ